jgi:hypothetical protein
MILILAPTRKIAEHIAQELRVRDNWPRFGYNVTHRWLDPRDVRTTLIGTYGREVVVATTARAPHTLGNGWRGKAWEEALEYLRTEGALREPKIIFHHLP